MSKLQFRIIRNGKTEYNAEETEEVMTAGSLQDAFTYSNMMESMRMESRPCSKSATTLCKKSNVHTLGSSGKCIRVDTLLMNQIKSIIKQLHTLPTMCKLIHQPDS